MIEIGNKGEWSELYAIGFLLAKGGGYAADSYQNPIPRTFYKVLEVFLEGHSATGSRKYRIHEDSIAIFSGSDQIATIDRAEVGKHLGPFFRDLISDENTKTFALESGTRFMKLLMRDRLAAPSNQKAHDVELAVEDWQSGHTLPKVGFSIKSQIGNPSTLLNASGATNLTYVLSIPSELTKDQLDTLQNLKAGKLLLKLKELKVGLSFEGYDNHQFRKNLEKIDSRMPDYLAEVVLNFFQGEKSTLREVVEKTFPSNLEESEQPIFKMKQFLGAVAMGMRPSQTWDGDITKFKGLLLAKLDGDVLFYYLYNIAEFQEFLYRNLKFEVASTTRHGFGKVYRDGDSWKVKLNLQVRFIK